MNRFHILCMIAVGSLTACTFGSVNETQGFFAPDTIAIFRKGPAEAQAGQCWGKDETPAVIETVTHKTLTVPDVRDSTGKLLRVAVYEVKTEQKIVEARTPVWFETPCPEVFTKSFITSLQRALNLRGIYQGPMDGVMSPATTFAIRTFQKPQGLNSPVLSLVAARKLGLVAYSREDIKKF